MQNKLKRILQTLKHWKAYFNQAFPTGSWICLKIFPVLIRAYNIEPNDALILQKKLPSNCFLICDPIDQRKLSKHFQM